MMRVSILALLAALLLRGAPALAAACSFVTLVAGPPKTIACLDTTATTWVVPLDWDSAHNTIAVIAAGGGGGGANTQPGTGGGGGQYAAATGVTLTPGATAGSGATLNSPHSYTGTFAQHSLIGVVVISNAGSAAVYDLWGDGS